MGQGDLTRLPQGRGQGPLLESPLPTPTVGVSSMGHTRFEITRVEVESAENHTTLKNPLDPALPTGRAGERGRPPSPRPQEQFLARSVGPFWLTKFARTCRVTSEPISRSWALGLGATTGLVAASLLVLLSSGLPLPSTLAKGRKQTHVEAGAPPRAPSTSTSARSRSATQGAATTVHASNEQIRNVTSSLRDAFDAIEDGNCQKAARIYRALADAEVTGDSPPWATFAVNAAHACSSEPHTTAQGASP